MSQRLIQQDFRLKNPWFFSYFCFLFFASQLWGQDSEDRKGYMAPWVSAPGQTEVHIFLHEKGEKSNVKFSSVELYSSSAYFDFQKQTKTSLKQGEYVSLINYFQWFQWDQKSPRNRYSSEFGIYSKSFEPVFQQFHSFTGNEHYNQFFQVNLKTPRAPVLHYQSSNKGIDEVKLAYANLYTEDMLIPLLRKMLWDKQNSMEINLLGNLSNPPGNFQVQYAKISVKDQHFPLKDFNDMDVVLVEVVRGDGRTANFWFSRNGNHRLVKAILHDGAVLSLIEYKRL